MTSVVSMVDPFCLHHRYPRPPLHFRSLEPLASALLTKDTDVPQPARRQRGTDEVDQCSSAAVHTREQCAPGASEYQDYQELPPVPERLQTRGDR